jgi:hypothetical protein
VIIPLAPVVMYNEGCVRDVCVQLHTIHDLDSQNILNPTPIFISSRKPYPLAYFDINMKF